VSKQFALNILQNATYQLDGQWLAGTVPVDLTGWTLTAQIRQQPTSSVVLHDLAPTVTVPLEGRWQIIVTDETSLAWAWTAGFWDLRAESPGGQVTRLVSGSVNVIPAVTRP